MTKREERQFIYEKYKGHCAYCGCELKKGWHVDHLEPVVRYNNQMAKPENDTIQNKMPSCPSCNINKHSMALEEFRKSIIRYVESLNNYSVQYKMAKKYGLITETNKVVKFYFEQYEVK